MTAFTLIVLFLIVSPFGKIKLGDKDTVPEFSFLSWLCMLFAAGVGIGMTFYGAAEPLSYYTGVFGYFDGKNLESAVNIRYLEKKEGQILYRSGGGITFMSNLESEYNELIEKIYVPVI